MSTMSPLAPDLRISSTNGTLPTVGRVADEPTAVLTVVTPAMAAAWLRTAHPNRPVSKQRVKTIERAIRGGLWQVNGQTLVLCPEFRLLDGRHRCMAIEAAAVPVQTMVVCGIDPACFATMDQGGKRSGGDVLAVGGHPHAKALASTLRWVWRYEQDAMRSPVVALSDYELPAYLSQHRGVPASLEWGAQIRALLPKGAGSALHYLMHAQDPVRVKGFFHNLAHGHNLTNANPEWHIRERIFRDKGQLHHGGIVARCALMILAWACVRQSRSFAPSVRWKGTEDKSVPFPAVV